MLVKLIEDYETTLVKGDGDITDQKVNIKGYTESLPSNGTKTLWGSDTDHFNPLAASLISIISDSPNDTSSGTGAKTVIITGVGYSDPSNPNDGEEITETVTLNGKTLVQTTKYYFCIYNFIVASVGSGNKNVGNIKAYVSDANLEVVNYIKANENNSSLLIYRVPQSKNLLVKNILVNGTCNGANLHLKIKNTNEIEYSEFVFRIGNFGGQLNFTVDEILKPKSVLWIKVVPDVDIPSSTENCAISAIVNGILYN